MHKLHFLLFVFVVCFFANLVNISGISLYLESTGKELLLAVLYRGVVQVAVVMGIV